MDNRFSTAFTFQLSLFFPTLGKPAPKTDWLHIGMKKPPRIYKMTPGLLKETSGEKQGLFVRIDGEKHFM